MSTENRSFGSNQSIDASQFFDRRSKDGEQDPGQSKERRQFSDSLDNLSPEAAELGKAIDQYKLVNRRKYIDYEEMLMIMKTLGYSK